jgi:glycosyltransferase involved in cell wall biosynthesis
MDPPNKPRVLVFIVAYNAEKTIASVVRRIPASLLDVYDVDVLIIDDASRDGTFDESHQASKAPGAPFPLRVLFNPLNQGYGGNQKLGYHYAIKYGYDFVALIHGDGQYAPECLPGLLEPLRTRQAAAVFGSRMMPPSSARKGGMPLYKFAGNKILTWIENKLLHAELSEFHSGYRIYSTKALAAIPFDRNSNDFHFDTEIIIQLMIAKLPITEIPIPTYYGDEICYVNGMKYAFHVVAAALKARLQEMGLFYDRRFDCAPDGLSPYTPKMSYRSPHSLALEFVEPESTVLDLGCAGGYMATALYETKQCSVTGVDSSPVLAPGMEAFYRHDLNDGPPEVDFARFDFVLMLDVLEHLSRPELFLEQLRRAVARNPRAEVMLSTGNVAFFVTRAMLLLGQFNYGKRGILDLTHTRLFTFGSLRRAVEQAGFSVVETIGVPGPFPLALGDNRASRFLVALNTFLIRLCRGLFSYQIFMRIRAQPVLASLLTEAEEHSAARISLIELSRAVEEHQPSFRAVDKGKPWVESRRPRPARRGVDENIG